MKHHTEYNYIHFVEIDPNLWECCSNERNSIVLGIVEYRKVWKQFVFQGEEGCIFSRSCLEDIIDFMSELKKLKG